MNTSQPLAGDTLAGYVIEALVGRGGMGEVFRAHDVRLDRTVALKVLGPHLAGSERFRERFLRESTLAARLDHPNVIPIFEAGESEGTLYIAMRLVEGTDLRAILRTEDALEPARAIDLLAPVAGALDAAHAAGLVHRDVKPANILVASSPELDPPEHVYLSDFGLTTLSADAGDSGPFTGTADYAAPELVTGGAVDHRVDVYALGCVFFECLTGRPPYPGDSVMAVLWGHVNDPVPAASERNSALPPAVDVVLGKALAKEPKARYSSCRDLVADLRRALGVEGPSGLRDSKHRRFKVLAAAVAIAAAAAVAAAVVLSRGSGTAAPAARAGELVRIDPDGDGTAKPIAVGTSPVAVAADSRAVWVASPGDGTLWRVNSVTGVPTRVAAIGVPGDLGIARNTAYVTSEGPQAFSGSVTAYDAGSGTRLGGFQLLACSIAAGTEGVWVAGCPHVQRISESPPYHIVQRVAVPFASPHVTANDRQEIGTDDDGRRLRLCARRRGRPASVADRPARRADRPDLPAGVRPGRRRGGLQFDLGGRPDRRRRRAHRPGIGETDGGDTSACRSKRRRARSRQRVGLEFPRPVGLANRPPDLDGEGDDPRRHEPTRRDLRRRRALGGGRCGLSSV